MQLANADSPSAAPIHVVTAWVGADWNVDTSGHLGPYMAPSLANRAHTGAALTAPAGGAAHGVGTPGVVPASAGSSPL